MAGTWAEVALVMFVGMGPVKVLVYYLGATRHASPALGRQVAVRAVGSATIVMPRPPRGRLAADAPASLLERGPDRGRRDRPARLRHPDRARYCPAQRGRCPADRGRVDARGALPDGRPAHPQPGRDRGGHHLLGRGIDRRRLRLPCHPRRRRPRHRRPGRAGPVARSTGRGTDLTGGDHRARAGARGPACGRRGPAHRHRARPAGDHRPRRADGRGAAGAVPSARTRPSCRAGPRPRRGPLAARGPCRPRPPRPCCCRRPRSRPTSATRQAAR